MTRANVASSSLGSRNLRNVICFEKHYIPSKSSYPQKERGDGNDVIPKYVYYR